MRFANIFASKCDLYERFKGIKKKEGLSPDNPIFINLKSNTMKNTMQKYCFFSIYANFSSKKHVFKHKIRMFCNIYLSIGQVG